MSALEVSPFHWLALYESKFTYLLTRLHSGWELSPGPLERETIALTTSLSSIRAKHRFFLITKASEEYHSCAERESRRSIIHCSNRTNATIAQIPLGSSRHVCILAVSSLSNTKARHTRHDERDRRDSQLSLLCNLYKLMICQLFTNLLEYTFI